MCFNSEPLAAFDSLHDFFIARVRLSLSKGAGPNLDADVNTYVTRICRLREMARDDVVQFVNQYSSFTHHPSIPSHISGAVLCRDEPNVREVIWETEDRYWQMIWTKER